MPRLLCTPCFERGRRVPAANVEDAARYHVTPRCADCLEGAAEAQAERDFAAYHGGGGAWPSASEQTDALQRAKGER